MNTFVIVSVSASRASAFIGGIQAFDAVIHTADGDISVSRVGNPGRNETPAQWAEWKFPVGSSVAYMAKS